MPYFRLFYHVVWSTHQRLPLITPEVAPHLYRTIRAKVETLQGLTHAVYAMPDHVHLVATVPPKLALATFIGQVKGSASHLVAHLPGVEAFAWQEEYGVVSVSERHLPIVVRYVQNQVQHHATNKINARLEQSA